MKERIKHLDGLRGLAILLVIGFHAYTRWASILPYGSRFSEIPIFKAGWVGVDLFFLISGYVILMTLERSDGAWDFLRRRWLRLFPAMAVCSAISFAFSTVLPDGPGGSPSFVDLIPGMLFIEPAWLHRIGLDWNAIEGTFWSIFVEVKFYLVAALLFSRLGAKRLAITLAGLYAISVAAAFAYASSPGVGFVSGLRETCLFLGLEHFGWFAAGAALLIHHNGASRSWLLFALVTALASSAFKYGLALRPAVVCAAVSMLFLFASRSPLLIRILGSRPLLFIGFISYPLYLVHEGILVRVTLLVGREFPGAMPQFLMPFPAILLTVAIAWGVALLEPRLRAFLAPSPR